MNRFTKYLAAAALLLGVQSAFAATYIMRAPSPGLQPSAPTSSASAPAPSPSDPYYSNVVLLMHLDGTNGSTSFTDQKGHALSDIGTPQIATSNFEVGGASGYFNGSSYLQMANSADFNFGSSDFTMEAWVYPTAAPSSTQDFAVYSQGETSNYYNLVSFEYAPYNGGGIRLLVRDSSNTILDLRGASTLPLNTWSNVAAVRSGSTVTLYVNGKADASATVSGSFPALTYNELIGGRMVGGTTPNYFPGYIDELRITNGVARYTSNYTPSTQPFPNQ